MQAITREEIMKIARLSHIKITDEELEKMRSHCIAVLEYAERVKDIAKDVALTQQKNMNVFRDDIILKTDPESIRIHAPEREGDYFVVPVILEGGQ